ncbi:MAG: hypothetical protein ABIK77_02875 [candidate division WOR-3 bacterium]|uniref:Uncharacterized protein n=1 Tax=candidate division WOR-3 bacterium TaxID=2052148 RepID=A0A7V4FEI2_UNCW3
MKDNLFSVADKLVKETKELLKQARTEEDLRIGFERILEPIKKSLNLNTNSLISRNFNTLSTMKHIGIPKFDPNNEIHKQLSYLSKECHRLKEEGKDKEIEKLEKEIDLLVKKLFNII